MTVVSETLQGVFYFYFIWKNITHFSFGKILLKPLIATVCMAALFYLVKSTNVFMQVSPSGMMQLVMYVGTISLLGLLTYLLILEALRFFSKEDKVLFKKLLGLSIN